MLQKLNERIQGVVAWLVIILIAITFTLFGVDYYLQSHQTSDSKVIINGQAISNQAFEVNYRRIRAQRDPGEITAETEKLMQKTVLEQLIANTVTVQAARKYGFEVSPEQANAAIVSIPQFQEDGHFSQERFQQALSSALFTPETFQKEVRQGMLLNQQRFAFVGSAFALPDEVQRFVRLFMQTRNYNYLLIPSSLFEKEIQITKEESEKYYEQHKEQFQIPEKVSIDYVQLSMPAIRSNIQIPDEDVQRYYDENQNNYRTPAQWQVAHILFAVPANASASEAEAIKQKAMEAYTRLQKDPSQFKTLVKTASDDKLSIAKDGELPWLTAGQTEFDPALVQLTRPDQISLPFRSRHGFEIFKLIAHKPAVVKPFAEVENAIRDQLAAEKAQTKYAEALEELSDLTYQNPDSLTPVAQALKLPVLSTEPFDRKGGQAGLTQNKSVINAAFSHDVLELSNNSEPIQIDNDNVIVLRIKKHFPIAQKSFKSVKAEIEHKLAEEFARSNAKKFGEQLLGRNKEEQKELLGKYNLQWQEITNATRENDSLNSMINDLAFSINNIDRQKGSMLADGKYVVIHLLAINDGNLSALDNEQQKSLAQQIEASYGLLDYDLYLNGLIQRADVEKH